MDPQPAEVLALREEPRVDVHTPALGIGVDTRHPGTYTVGIEDLVPRRVQGIGEVDAPAVTADLHHLRAAAET